jgi:hypothetical protein
LTQYGVRYASSTTAEATTAAGTVGYPLVANSSAAPTFQQLSLTAGVTGVLPTANGGAGTWTQDLFICNGTSTAFTMSFTPSSLIVVQAHLDGGLLIQGASYDYTTSGTTLTLATACSTGQKLNVVYTH